jgi:hypothetical protein
MIIFKINTLVIAQTITVSLAVTPGSTNAWGASTYTYNSSNTGKGNGSQTVDAPSMVMMGAVLWTMRTERETVAH